MHRKCGILPVKLKNCKSTSFKACSLEQCCQGVGKFLHSASSHLTGKILLIYGSSYNYVGKMTYTDSQIPGTLPPSFGTLIALESIQFNNNILSGTIPTSFGSLTTLRIMIFGHNQRSGTFPSIIGSLSLLNVLKWRTNV